MFSQSSSRVLPRPCTVIPGGEQISYDGRGNGSAIRRCTVSRKGGKGQPSGFTLCPLYCTSILLPKKDLYYYTPFFISTLKAITIHRLHTLIKKLN
jgi:hypothetical protein